jgi:hypothetical protein
MDEDCRMNKRESFGLDVLALAGAPGSVTTRISLRAVDGYAAALTLGRKCL